ncbi:TPA: hypothetical protein QH575_004403 [Enterobacter kobei]|jgi:hypothetical protein|uniref:Uncharacterized protein n=2 Tax=Enterobacter cloacae complex TaxID=354276 RepID=A0A2J0PLR8_9ENTR|nr:MULTISPECIES: hypothetical protein [Enterobacter cloacae complex]HCM9197740.1 hypothetical protein [Enterobacter hormaechei subsp. xiangfangensis]OEH09992.1 hypothetical protein AN693_0224010 [Enterobacter kobei]OWS97394.1 hypothetical protein CEQ52_02645 [Enterobacter kobei]PJD74682.1 hypothetical protein B9Q37_12375 [Enterobacter kobei]HDS7687338.1 hypothetical protein [Enterobacter kobei]
MSPKNTFEKAAILLSFVSVILSGVATYFAYGIGKEQVRAAKIQYSPIFTFKKEYTKNPSGDKYMTEYLSIENEGYPILAFKANLDTILILKITDYRTKPNTTEKYFPVNYFNGQSSSSGGKGQLSMFIGNENLWLLSRVESEMIDFNMKFSPKKIINYQTKTIVKISYIDASEESHEKYFIDEIPVQPQEYFSLKSKVKNIPNLSKNDLELNKLIDGVE